MAVSMADGLMAYIEHASVDTAKERLGVHTCPSGKNEVQIKVMQKKTQDWVDKAKNGHLHQRHVWFMLEKQFWPRVGHGLCSNTASFAKLESCLKKQYWELLPLGGVICSTKAGFDSSAKVSTAWAAHIQESNAWWQKRTNCCCTMADSPVLA